MPCCCSTLMHRSLSQRTLIGGRHIHTYGRGGAIGHDASAENGMEFVLGASGAHVVVSLLSLLATVLVNPVAAHSEGVHRSVACEVHVYVTGARGVPVSVHSVPVRRCGGYLSFRCCRFTRAHLRTGRIRSLPVLGVVLRGAVSTALNQDMSSRHRSTRSHYTVHSVGTHNSCDPTSCMATCDCKHRVPSTTNIAFGGTW